MNIDIYKQNIEYGEFKSTANDYFDFKAINSSSLKNGLEHPLYMDLALNNEIEYKKSKFFELGTQVHSYLFEPEEFSKTYFISEYKIDGRATVKSNPLLAKDTLLSLGRKRIDKKIADQMFAMVAAMKDHPEINSILSAKGKTETNIIWKDLDFDLNCKGRLDKFIHYDDFTLIVDLKTTKDIGEHAFRSDFRNYKYDLQAAFYTDGANQVFKRPIRFAFIVVNKEEPFISDLYMVKDETIERGRKNYKRAMEKFVSYHNNRDSIYDIKEI